MKGRFERSITSLIKFGRSLQVAQFLPLLWILLLSWLVLFNHLGNTGLLDETEPLFAEAARQMQVTGDWITPYFNGVTRFDKPPLIYWLMAIAYETIGVSAWAARLPSAIAGTLLIGFCFYTLRFFEHQFKPHTGHLKILPFLGSAIFALNMQTLFFGRLGYSDMLLSVCFGGALFSFFLGYSALRENPKGQTRFYLAFYGFLALAVLTKGPVGVVLPGAIVLIFLFCVGKLREVLREIKLVPGMVIFLALSVPWYVLAYLRNGESFVNSFFGYHNLERFTAVVNQHQGAWYFHLLIVLIGFFPWSIYLPAAIVHSLKPQSWRQSPRSSHLGLFALIWFAVVLGFFTIAVTKYITYTLPLVPAAAILVALWWNDQQQDAPKWGLKLSVYLSLGLSIALAAVTLYSPNWLNSDPSMPALGLQMQEARLPQIGFLIWLGGAIAGIFLIFGRNMRWFWAVNLATYAAFILFFITPFIGVLDAERQLPLREVAQTVIQVRQGNEPIVMATDSFEKPSLVFYTQQPITFFNRSAKIKPYLEQVRQQKTQRSILMVTTPRTLNEAKILPQAYQLLKQVGLYRVIRFWVSS